MSETITIGVDHGYYAMKTTHFSFPTGLVQYEHEPYTSCQRRCDFVIFRRTGNVRKWRVKVCSL